LREAELAALWRPNRNRRVLGEIGARVQVEEQSALESEHRDGAIRTGHLVRPLRPDNAVRLETETTVEREREFEVGHGQGDHVQTRFHGVVFVPAGR
jgi:hypothetical protein